MSALLPEYSPALYSWDLSLWRIMHQISCVNPHQAASAFDLPLSIINHVSELSPREVEQLSSGVLCSFVPVFSHYELQNIVLHSNEELSIGIDSNLNILERIYWELLARSSMHDPKAASIRFGVATETAEMLSKASPIVIHELCTSLETDFRLRFAPEIIVELQYASPTTALLKRAAAALG